MAQKSRDKKDSQKQVELNAPIGIEATTQQAVTPQALAEVAAELANLIEQRQPILEAFEILANQQGEPLRHALMSVRADVRAGVAIAAAMAKQATIFPAHYVEVVRAGEAKGGLIQALCTLAGEDSAKVSQQAATDKDQMLTLDEAVQFLGTSKPTMHRLLRQGDIQGLKVGRQWRFRKADLIAHLERRPPAVALAATEDMDAELQFFAEKLAATGWQKPATTDEDEKIVRLVNAIIALALHEKASDIHLDAKRDAVTIRNRIDGLLREVRTMPGRLHQPLVDRFKMMSSMDITEKRLPQDGSIHISFNKSDFVLRVASMPSSYGEAITIRILYRSSGVPSHELLDFAAEDWQKIEGWLHQPYGLILMTGPMGSGKTTVLSSCLSEIAGPENKTVSIEDPVEYQLPNVTQTFVNEKAGLTFAVGLRAMLRSDPDIIMIGEMRDLEVAQLAHQAALTGHLVLSTLTTISAAGTILRLLDMGLESFLLTQAVIGITSQRLARGICPDCKEVGEVSPALLERVRPLAEAGGYAMPDNATFMRGQGCPKCRQTGYHGRKAIYEVLQWSPVLTEATLRRVGEKELTEIAVAGGMKTLLADGVRKAVEGITTLDEVLRVVNLAL